MPGAPCTTGPSQEVLFDQRLFNQTQGLNSRYGKEDDTYNVYEKPWREAGATSQVIFRPSKSIDKDVHGDYVEKLIKASKFVWDKDTDHVYGQVRDGPVHFEKAAEADPFGLSQFLKEAKTAKHSSDSARSSNESRPKKTNH